MEFLQELNESRLYRRLAQVRGRSVHYLAERLFEHLLVLQIFANTNKKLAARYAKSIMKQQQFDGFRTSQPDLYNLIVMVLKQDQYNHLIDTDSSVVLPELRMRRNLKAIAREDFDNDDYSYMMIMLQRVMPNLGGQLIQLRRQISSWKTLPSSEKKIVVRRLRMHMREKGMQSDFYYHLERLGDLIA